MKLRIGGNSLRLRVLRSEVESLRNGGRLSETLHLGGGEHETLTYALEGHADVPGIDVRFSAGKILVLLPLEKMQQWATSDEVGIYDHLPVDDEHTLVVLVEKDFACLDLSDAENVDTFHNPNSDAAC